MKLVGGMLSRSAHLPSFAFIASGTGDLVRQSPFPMSRSRKMDGPEYRRNDWKEKGSCGLKVEFLHTSLCTHRQKDMK